MIALIQRVTQASVTIERQIVAQIGKGILALIGIERGDGPQEADRLLQRLLDYRIFSDDHGKMNLSLRAVSGELLLVPQFTLAADTSSGLRPGFSTAAAPAEGKQLFHYLCQQAGQHYHQVHTGRFGADMQIALINDGPVTFRLQITPQTKD